MKRMIIPILNKVNSKNNSHLSFKRFLYEFHISRKVREKYQFEDTLFSTDGNVIFADFKSVREFTTKLNLIRTPEQQVRPGVVNAMGLLDEIYHYLLRIYEKDFNPGVFSRAYKFLIENLKVENVEPVLENFIELFPPNLVYKNKLTSAEYLQNSTEGKSHKEAAIEELILLYFANFNPANKNLTELFDQNYFNDKVLYNKIITLLDTFFLNEKKFGPDDQPIFEMLRTPILNSPDNIEEQLVFIKEKWNILLDPKFLTRLLSSTDLLKEDKNLHFFGGGGGAPSVVPKYKQKIDEADILALGKSSYKYGMDSHLSYFEAEQFTPDIDWMPRVVLLAKNIYVWMDQLSKKYERQISTLDQIPDEELDQIAVWNFTGLWLIGIWERSHASQKIKQMMGNPDAVSSAYSLYDYEIASDLGGERAYHNLNERAKQRGIRLASDMVPNHMGIFSKWVIEHPEYFIQSPYPPFPNYSFTGPDLSESHDIQLRIEDGYWTKRDAAVVFQRIDNKTGDVRYIYHGNDGTNMPWNDTAQLNMLKSEVREAVIQMIFHVASKFSIIRFDAAMTLTKKHYQRLWYPIPGTGGDIPSRAEHGLSFDAFNDLFPKEFWREVVDRFTESMPEVLLLAEAFWLMEGYFVRTLGMHRVYNSAFMHMIMKEENAKYRDVISNTLEFNPEILKRYVNFMSNPDEETAIKQFGTGDKYFGTCVLMTTLPGLPMFAHGQIEGYTEKYGMEYRRAYYNESADQWLIDRHAREIFPLMKKRYLFSQVENFWFYDFYDAFGNVNENVFVYSNRYKDERGLVFYNNKYDRTTGWINLSTTKNISGSDTTASITSINLVEALNLKIDEKIFYTYYEHISGKQFIVNSVKLNNKGFYAELNGFQYLVYVDFKEVYDHSGEYKKVDEKLNGVGVSSIQNYLEEIKLEPVHESFSSIFEQELLEKLIDSEILESELKTVTKTELKPLTKKYKEFLDIAFEYLNLELPKEKIVEKFEEDIRTIKLVNDLENIAIYNLKPEEIQHIKKISRLREDSNYKQNVLLYLIYSSIINLGSLAGEEFIGENAIELYDRLILEKPVTKLLDRLGGGENLIISDIRLMMLMFKYNTSVYSKIIGNNIDLTKNEDMKNLFRVTSKLISRVLKDEEVKDYIGVNYFKGIWYYSKENFEELHSWFFNLSLMKLIDSEFNTVFEDKISTKHYNENMEKLFNLIKNRFLTLLESHLKIEKISILSGYQLEEFVGYLESEKSSDYA